MKKQLDVIAYQERIYVKRIRPRFVDLEIKAYRLFSNLEMKRDKYDVTAMRDDTVILSNGDKNAQKLLKKIIEAEGR